VSICERCDLRKVRDDDDLAMLGEVQAAPAATAASPMRVDLVEDQRGTW
jgi:hypothetical protein